MCQGRVFPLAHGQSFTRTEFPMLSPSQPGGSVAAVSANPSDPAMLGLRNMTGHAWTAWMPDGTQRQVVPGQTMRLADGVVVQWGSAQAQVRAAPAGAGHTPRPAPLLAPVPPSGILPQLLLDIQGRMLPLTPGIQLSRAHLPMLSPSQPGGPVAEVSANPSDPAMLGLRNMTGHAWTAWMPDGTQRQVVPGQTMRLADGISYRWGGAQCRVCAAGTVAALGGSPSPLIAPMPLHFPRQISNQSLGLSQVVPVLSGSTRQKLRTFLVPGIVTCLSIALLFSNIGNTSGYIFTLSTFLLLVALFAISMLCGKQKPWWQMLGVAVSCILLIIVLGKFGYFFPVPSNLLGFTIVGMREELLKSLPVFTLWLIGAKIGGPWESKFGIKEPVDAILIAAASAAGFTFLETNFQYVPGIIRSAGAAAGVELLVPRTIGAISGHIAYSGYFGYFIGLAAVMPRHRKRLLLIGFFTASGLHAVWDTFASMGVVAQTLIGGLSFGSLIAAILKARQLSPGAGSSVTGSFTP